jgi:aryl-alcohol dehydrogenase-like predicted oxidoreductase
MNKKLLGNSDLQITTLGFGSWAIGGAGWEFGWGHQEDDESIKAITRALDLNVNWIDTARIYGLGHSEEIVAEAVSQYNGHKPYIFTKCSMVWDNENKIILSHDPASIRRECESSLKRLKVDAIDLYQIHWPPKNNNDEAIDPAWEMMAKLKEEGKVKWIGVCNFNVAQLKRAQKIAPVTSLQPPYNLINRKIEPEILTYCKENNIGVIVYSPMCSGLLTGSFTKERAANLSEDDWRSRNQNFLEPKLSKNLELAEELKTIGKKYNRSAGEIAIAWTLKHPAVTAAIVGARNAKQVDGVMTAGEITLTDQDIQSLESINIVIPDRS